MFNEEEELARRLFTADTADASWAGWFAFKNKDKYERMARVALNFMRHDEGTRVRVDGLIGTPPPASR